jgi:hypothetical protein
VIDCAPTSFACTFMKALYCYVVIQGGCFGALGGRSAAAARAFRLLLPLPILLLHRRHPPPVETETGALALGRAHSSAFSEYLSALRVRSRSKFSVRSTVSATAISISPPYC